MSRHLRKKRKKKSAHHANAASGGTPAQDAPDVEKADITVAKISADGQSITTSAKISDCRPGPDGTVTWIHIHGTHDLATIREIAALYKLHPHAVDEISDTGGRPRFGEFGDYVFIVLESFIGPTGLAIDERSRNVSFVLGTDYIISTQEADEDLISPILERIRKEPDWFFTNGASYIAYCIMDTIVDNYFTILEKIDDAVFDLEDMTTMRHDETTLRTIQVLRRKTMFIRRAAWPLREVVASLQKRRAKLPSDPTMLYFSEVYNHVVQVIDTTETFREVLSNIFDIYLTAIGNRMNEIMKLLAVFATIIMPMTVITGLYGMNFKHMPELKWLYGYPFALSLMVIIAVVMLLYFRRKKWL